MKDLHEKIIAHVSELYPDYEILLASGFDEAFVGVATQAGANPVAVYDRKKCIDVLMQDMSEEDAYEYFEFNVIGSYVGENTPMFMETFYQAI